MKTVPDPPDSLMENVAWDFSQWAPDSLDAFVAHVEAYNRDLNIDAGVLTLQPLLDLFGFTLLSHDTGLCHLFVRYSYGVAIEGSEGEEIQWIDVVEQIEIMSETPITYGEVLFQIHRHAKKHLAENDHRFFEGLYLVEESKGQPAPTYEIFLGS